MNTKLTLNLDKDIVEKAKVYAKSHKISLSQLVESYFALLISKKSREIEITPLVESLRGVIELNKDFKAAKIPVMIAEEYLISIDKSTDS